MRQVLLDLNKLFIEPRHIRNAAERAGAVRIGEAPADALPGRLLPLYEVRLDSTGDRDLEPHLGGRSKR